MIEDFRQIAARTVGCAPGMACGLTPTSLLPTLGCAPAAASAAAPPAATATTAARATCHAVARNVDRGLVRPLAIASMPGGIAGHMRLRQFVRAALVVGVASRRALMPVVGCPIVAPGPFGLWRGLADG